MTVRRDYTNGSGYICPTENTAVHNLDRPPERKISAKPYKTTLREQDLRKLDRPTAMQDLAQIAARDAAEAKDKETLKRARQLLNVITTIAQLADFSVTAVELRPKGSPDTYYKDTKTQTIERR